MQCESPSVALADTQSAEREPRTACGRNCSVSRTVDIIGDGWSFMILRESYFGVRRFKAFQTILGLPRGTLAARLAGLTEQGLLRKIQYSNRPPRYEYRLTRMGFDLYPVMLTMLRFGDKWLSEPEGPPLQLKHNCGAECQPIVACSNCGMEVHAREVRYRPGPGAGIEPVTGMNKRRRSADPTALERRRPSSVARTLKIIGDRWSFLVIREAFFSVRRFDDFQKRLSIASNVLSDRLTRFVEEGILSRELYRALPERYEYRLTDKGLDLYGPFIAMLRWGDTWLSAGKPPLIVTHTRCGADFEPTVSCNQCKRPILAHEMSYQTRYIPPDSDLI